jgi:hypothetical protein
MGGKGHSVKQVAALSKYVSEQVWRDALDEVLAWIIDAPGAAIFNKTARS